MQKNKGFWNRNAAIIIALAIFVFAFGGALIANFQAKVERNTKGSAIKQLTQTQDVNTEDLQSWVTILQDINQIMAETETSEEAQAALIKYFTDQACELKFPEEAEKQEMCKEKLPVAIETLLIIVETAESPTAALQAIKNELENSDVIKLFKDDLKEILEAIKNLPENGIEEDELKNLALMIQAIYATYGNIERTETLLLAFACPKTEHKEACETVVTDIASGLQEGQTPEQIATQIVKDLRTLAYENIPKIHQQIMLMLQSSIDLLKTEQGFIAIRYSQSDPQAEETRTVYNNDIALLYENMTEMENSYNELKNFLIQTSGINPEEINTEEIFAEENINQFKAATSSTKQRIAEEGINEENKAQFKNLVKNYLKSVSHILVSFYQIYPSARSGIAYINNYHRTEYLEISSNIARDMVSTLELYQELEGIDTSKVIAMIEDNTTNLKYKSIGDPRAYETQNGFYFTIDPKVKTKVPTNAGYQQMINLTHDKLDKANSQWKNTITQNETSTVENARKLQAEYSIFMGQLQKTKTNILREICLLNQTNKQNQAETKDCVTNMNLVLNEIINNGENVGLIFCQNKPNPAQCEKYYNTLKNGELSEQAKAMMSLMDALLFPGSFVPAYMIEAAISNAESIIQASIDNAKKEASERISQATSNFYCNSQVTEDNQTEEELEQDVEECRKETIATITKAVECYEIKNKKPTEEHTQEEIDDEYNQCVSKLQELILTSNSSSDLLNLIKALLTANRLSTETLRNREPNSITITILENDYTTLKEEYDALLPPSCQTDQNSEECQNDLQNLEFNVLQIIRVIVILTEEEYFHHLEGAYNKITTPALNRYTRFSEAFGYDTPFVIEIASDLYGIETESLLQTANEILLLSRDLLSDTQEDPNLSVQAVNKSWEDYFKNEISYKNASNNQSTLKKNLDTLKENQKNLLKELSQAVNASK